MNYVSKSVVFLGDRRPRGGAPHLGEERPPIAPALPAKERVATAEGLVTGGRHRGHSARSGNSCATRGYGGAARRGRARGITTRA